MEDLLRHFILLAAVIMAVSAPAGAGEPALSRLEGVWRATGTVEGEAVSYRAEGRMVLMGRHLRFSMIDTAKDPKYEAAVYISKSKEKRDLVAHWLDNFGADGARVVGFGEETDKGFVLVFDYGEAVFRDRFEFVNDDSFTLKIDACVADACNPFADYVFSRR